MDGKAPCIAEAARRLLRTEGVTLRVPATFTVRAEILAMSINDGIAKLILEPTIERWMQWVVEIEGPEGTLARFGGEEPEMDVCWIPDDENWLEKTWARFTRQADDLIAAGYPGCVGCGGPGSEGPWDEAASRARAGANAGGT